MRISLFIILLSSCLPVYSGGQNYQYSEDSLSKLYQELHYLREVGIEIHQKYDDKIAADSTQLLYCQGEYSYLSTRAKSTIGIANRLESVNQKEYIATGWKAFDCIKCTGDVNSCDAVPATLKLIEQEYLSQQQ